ncbi:MAG: hypothetical protein OSB46_16285 [Alphaproteobacteria bacterium]|nr:hypothetical protein [Alphaproteobacteria bacterium]
MKWAVTITVLAFIHAIFPGYAEGQKIPGQAVEIEADNGIEWNRDQRMYVARGNARAARGGAEIFADELTAYYRGNDAEDKGSGKNNKEGQTIFRVDADGHVRVRSKNNQAYGDQAVYHVEQAVFVLVGKTLRLETARAKITAQDSLEYWEDRQLAVARGGAIATSENRRLRADILTAHIDNQGRQEIKQIDAFGNVVVSTRNVIARGDEGVYNPKTSIATLCGGVKITRGGNQLNGDCAEVNLRSGKSRLIGGRSRVKGLLSPKK